MKTAPSLAPIGGGHDFRRRLGRLAELLVDNDSRYIPETERLLDDIAAAMMAGGEMTPAGWVDFLRPSGGTGSRRPYVDGSPGANRRLGRLGRSPFWGGIVEGTVKGQLKVIYRQLGVKNRTQAAMLAVSRDG